MKKKLFFFVLNKYQDVTNISTLFFQGLFKSIVFRSVALVKKGYFRFFFTQTGLFTTLYPTLCIKKNYKNLLNFYSLKVKNSW